MSNVIRGSIVAKKVFRKANRINDLNFSTILLNITIRFLKGLAK